MQSRPKAVGGCLVVLVACARIALGQAAANPSLAEAEEAAIRAAVNRVADSVVQIRTIGGLEEVDRTLLTNGPTTGLVVSSDGWIVSSAFNFIQQPASILVTFASGEQAPAELVAKDHSRRLVLLKAQGVSGLAVPELVPVDEIRVGEWAIAVGRTYRAEQPNISVGIVSALGRMFGKVLQTDAGVSTANYGGPLVDLRGRVLGVLVPIAPQSTSEVAGTEWYDSGIGFAVPLAAIGPALERMKTGKDQFAGVMGIGLSQENPHDSPARLATVLATSPAGKAGLKKGDTIVEIDGRPIHTYTDLQFALGPHYAGDKVRVVAARDKEKIERTIELAGELEPFRHAFLGILPMREPSVTEAKSKPEKTPASAEKTKDQDSPEGVAVRMVYAGSPAAAAGIQPGDRIVSIDGTKIGSLKAAIGAMNNVLPGAKIDVRARRGERSFEASIVAAKLPTNVPSELPPANGVSSPAPGVEAKLPALTLHDLKLAEFPHSCRVYVPASVSAQQSAGVILWLHAPGEQPSEELFRTWQPTCERDGLIFVAPSSTDAAHWDRTELEYLRRLSERVLKEYRVDRNRVVVFGEEGGGAMAYLLALVCRDLFTGVATSAAVLPRTVDPPKAEPAARLAVFAGLPANGDRQAQLQLGLRKLASAGYPITAITTVARNGRLTDDEREQLSRWIDTLDRF